MKQVSYDMGTGAYDFPGYNWGHEPTEKIGIIRTLHMEFRNLPPGMELAPTEELMNQAIKVEKIDNLMIDEVEKIKDYLYATSEEC